MVSSGDAESSVIPGSPVQPVITGWDQDGTWFVDVPSFEGPFDLLLQLVARHEVDITAIPLSKVVDEFLTVMTSMELNTTTEFLIVAATLVEIKALRLLPDQDEDEIDDVVIRARDLLYARLLEYRMVRDAAVFLDQRLGLFGQEIPRQVPLEPTYRTLQPPTQIGMDIAALGRLAYKVCTPSETTIDTSHIRAKAMRVHDAARIVLDWLRHGPTAIRTIMNDCTGPDEIVAHFLAILELYKLDWLQIEEDDTGVLIAHDPNAPARPLPTLVELS
ncbi:ScpA family protein [Stomatohabitans albus]|uniref:segregation and condensation protein A n=1 Tax=Stomatohabitans albus TaxID=3110766 RepID=UPI00300C4DA8